MSAPYAGSPAFPASILLPDDGEPIEAGSVNVPFEGVADRTVWLYQRCFAVAEFLVPAAAWVAPAGVAYAIAVGYGGGGGGGGATDGLALDDAFAMGAAGGGGAPEQMAIIPLVAGATYSIDVGVGGTGGVNGPTTGTAGLPGQASTVTRVSTGEVLCEFGGGGGGGPGASNAAPVGSTFMALGGPPWAALSGDEWIGPGTAQTLSWTTAAPILLQYPLPPGSGGPSYHVRPPGSRAGRNGLPQRTRVRYAAGMGIAGFGGAPGADSGLRRGGAGGGGGGGGPTGSAGFGGHGGDGNNAGVAVAGANGGSAAPNSGGGGGGGGGGGAGNGPANNGVGGTGGTGGTGRVRLYAFGIRP